jgi:hypothetical protein
MEILFCNKTVECPETPMAFDRTEYGKLLAIMERLAEPKALTPNERRDLAVAMHTVLRSAVCLDPAGPSNPTRLTERSAIGAGSILPMRSCLRRAKRMICLPERTADLACVHEVASTQSCWQTLTGAVLEPKSWLGC